MQEKMVVNYWVINIVFQVIESMIWCIEYVIEVIVNCILLVSDVLIMVSNIVLNCDDGYDLVDWGWRKFIIGVDVVNVCCIDFCIIGGGLLGMGKVLDLIVLIYQIIFFVIDVLVGLFLLVVIDIVFKF